MLPRERVPWPKLGGDFVVVGYFTSAEDFFDNGGFLPGREAATRVTPLRHCKNPNLIKSPSKNPPIGGYSPLGLFEAVELKSRVFQKQIITANFLWFLYKIQERPKP